MQMPKALDLLQWVFVLLLGSLLLVIWTVGILGLYQKVFSDPFFPWDRRNTNWNISSTVKLFQSNKIPSQVDHKIITKSYVSTPIVITRNFKWPYQERNDKGEGPWLLTRSNCEDTHVREEMLETGMFANSFNNAKSILQLTIDEHPKLHLDLEWRGATPLRNSAPISIDRNLQAKIIEIETGNVTAKQSWDANYAIAPKMTSILNSQSLDKACKKMENWLASLDRK